jgi:hypothetical protein
LKDSAIPAGNLVFPYHQHLKFSSPRMSVQNKEIKSGIFPGEGIIIEDGKLYG